MLLVSKTMYIKWVEWFELLWQGFFVNTAMISLYGPSSIVHGGGQNPANIIQKNKRDLALPSSFYGGLGLEKLAEKVKFFIGTTLGKTENGFQNKGKPGPA